MAKVRQIGNSFFFPPLRWLVFVMLQDRHLAVAVGLVQRLFGDSFIKHLCSLSPDGS